MTALRRTAALTAVLTYVLIVLGALVRATGSGLSCPDWPMCYGYWIPTPERLAALEVGYTFGQVMLEWWHRFIAGVLVGPLVLAMTVLAWRMRAERPGLFRQALLLLVLLLFQALLGGVTVLDQNSPWSVALHLGTALVLLALVVLIWERSRPVQPAPAEAGVAPLAALVWVLALATMVTAAMTAKMGASLACSTWPLCDGAIVPDLGHEGVRMHFAHRSLAALTGIGLLGLALLTRAHRGLAGLALALVVVQIGLGALVIVLFLPVWAAVTHQAVGVAIFAVISLLLWRCSAAAPDRAYERLRRA